MTLAVGKIHILQWKKRLRNHTLCSWLSIPIVLQMKTTGEMITLMRRDLLTRQTQSWMTVESTDTDRLSTVRSVHSMVPSWCHCCHALLPQAQMRNIDTMTTYDPNMYSYMYNPSRVFCSHITQVIAGVMRMRTCLDDMAAAASAARLVQLLAVAVALAGVLQPCRARPLDQRRQRLQTLLQKAAGGREDRSEILCHLCEVCCCCSLYKLIMTLAGLQAAVAVVKEYLEEGASVEDMFPVLEPLCVLFLNQSFDYNGPYMCPGVIHSYGPVVSPSTLPRMEYRIVVLCVTLARILKTTQQVHCLCFPSK